MSLIDDLEVIPEEKKPIDDIPDGADPYEEPDEEVPDGKVIKSKLVKDPHICKDPRCRHPKVLHETDGCTVDIHVTQSRCQCEGFLLEEPELVKKCTNCDTMAFCTWEAEDRFGVYVKNGKAYFQSRCYECRR